MKFNYLLGLLAAGVIFLTASTIAEEPANKLGYINSLELLDAIPEVKLADSLLGKMAKEQDGLLGLMNKELEAKYRELDELPENTTQSVVDYLVQEIKDLGSRIQKFQTDAQTELGNRRTELYQPI